MVGVSADVLEIVVFPADAHTLLAVDGSPVLGHLAVGVNRAQEDGLELKKKHYGQGNLVLPVF